MPQRIIAVADELYALLQQEHRFRLGRPTFPTNKQLHDR